MRALQKDGWIITHDPLVRSVGRRDLLIDLGAEQILAAEREGKRIAVEIKSFVKLSLIQDLKEALGQFVLYEDVLARSESQSDRTLFLAIRKDTYDEIFEEPIGEILLDNKRLRLIVFDEAREVIIQWIS